jgi:hypothetical protein
MARHLRWPNLGGIGPLTKKLFCAPVIGRRLPIDDAPQSSCAVNLHRTRGKFAETLDCY